MPRKAKHLYLTVKEREKYLPILIRLLVFSAVLWLAVKNG